MARTKVQSELIATNAISGTIIADGAITSTHLAANCVDSSELVTGSIDTIHIAANQVTATKIVTNGVLTRHISDDQVTAAKLANSINTDIATGPAALPKAGGTMTGTIAGFTSTGIDDNADATAITIDSSERVGIGETSPETSLHIKNAGNSFLTLERSGTSGGTGKFGINMEGGSSQQTTMGYDDGGKLVIGRSSDPATMAGFSNDFVFDSSGNVGIGTTPSTGWVNSTDFAALQIGSGLALWGRGSGDHERLGLTANIYHDGSAYKHIHTGRVTSYEQNDGKHLFKYHASQSAGTSVTPTTALTIDTTGNLLVGTTSTTVGAGGSGVKGFRVDGSSGIVQAAASGNISAIFNRTTNDGDIVSLRKNGTVVGSIGTAGSDIYIAGLDSNHAALRLAAGAKTVLPVTNAGALSDNDTDLGQSNARFKNLYFSGGLYGGTEVQTDTIGVGAVASGGSVARNTSENDGIFWHTSKNDYAIYRTTGAWSGSYQQLKLDWDTGIYIDGGTSYGASGVHISEKVSLGDSSYSNFGSPNYQVHIVGDGTALAIESGTGEAYIGSQNTSYFHFLGNRNFYFGNRCEANGGFHTYSDERLKENITPISDALDKVSQMNGITFNWINAENRGGGDPRKQFGVTAQNMLEVDSELPTLNKDPLASQDEIDNEESTDYYTMDYNRITPFLIEAVKELKTKLEAAEARIATLEG